MDLPLSAKVLTREGPCGKLTCAIIDPRVGRVTHLVVHLSGSFGEEVLVPVSWVEKCDEGAVTLQGDCPSLENCPHFITAEIIPGIPLTGGLLSDGMGISPMEIPVITQRQIPPGEQAIGKGSPVKAYDGTVGQVEELQMTPSGRITNLIVQEGHFWDHKKHVAIPVSFVDHLDENRIYLRTDRKTVEELPELKNPSRF